MSESFVRSIVAMDTIVTIEVVGHGATAAARREREDCVDDAFEWFHRVEACCSRFDGSSEARKLTGSGGKSVALSEILFQALQYAVAVSEETGGAFDPTVGHRVEGRGFDRNHRTGERERTTGVDEGVSFRDIILDAERRTVRFLRPLVLDLGGVAKGLAIDLAAATLEPFGNFAIDAGGDLYFAGRNARGETWSAGIRNPRQEGELLERVSVSNGAVCTSGDYERVDAATGASHIVDPRDARATSDLASVTVVARAAITADALATAAFVLGADRGAEFLEEHGVDALLLTPALERRVVRGDTACFTRQAALR